MGDNEQQETAPALELKGPEEGMQGIENSSRLPKYERAFIKFSSQSIINP
jgi:hypothetical protein